MRSSVIAIVGVGIAACSFDPSTEGFQILDDGAIAPPIDASVEGPVPDGNGTDGAATPDAQVPTCQNLGPFSTPSQISEVSSASLDNAPTLSGDELTMVIHSTRAGGQGNRDLWIAQRANLGQSFSTPVNMSAVNSGSDEFGPSLSSDGLTLFFGTNRAGGLGDYDIWASKRISIGDPFAAPVALPSVNSSTTDYFPAISADGLTLYFASTRSGGQGNHDVWSSTRASADAAFAAPTILSEVNSSSSDEAIAISGDGLSIFVQSSRPGTLGGHDVWLATRSTTSQPFSTPTNVAEINSSAQDQATWLSSDGLRLYQASDRDGSWSIYVSERSCED